MTFDALISQVVSGAGYPLVQVPALALVVAITLTAVSTSVRLLLGVSLDEAVRRLGRFVAKHVRELEAVRTSQPRGRTAGRIAARIDRWANRLVWIALSIAALNLCLVAGFLTFQSGYFGWPAIMGFPVALVCCWFAGVLRAQAAAR